MQRFRGATTPRRLQAGSDEARADTPRVSPATPARSPEATPAVDAAATPPSSPVPERSPAGLAGAAAPVIDGPLPPAPPATIARDTAGRATLRAVRVFEPVRIDGALDERVYQDVPPASGFIQVEPVEGAAATEQTEI